MITEEERHKILEEERRKNLEYENYIKEVTGLRSPPSDKPWWESTPLITSATAVLTVALTAYAGFLSQRSLRTNDLAIERAKASYQQEVAVLQAAHLLATESVHYADERTRLMTHQYDALEKEQQRRITDSVNAADDNWRKGRQTAKVGLELEFGDDRRIIGAWDSLSARVDRYANCSERPPATGCNMLLTPANEALETFRTLVVEHIRRHQSQVVAR